MFGCKTFFARHDWSKWETVSVGTLNERHMGDPLQALRTVGEFITQRRVCAKCERVQLARSTVRN